MRKFLLYPLISSLYFLPSLAIAQNILSPETPTAQELSRELNRDARGTPYSPKEHQKYFKQNPEIGNSNARNAERRIKRLATGPESRKRLSGREQREQERWERRNERKITEYQNDLKQLKTLQEELNSY